jgi:Uncharacterized protein conserved in bacteria (DUF2125)
MKPVLYTIPHRRPEKFMPHSKRFGSRELRHVLVAATALCSFPLAAFAADVPPTPEGAQSIVSALSPYLGQGAATASPDGDHYAVTIDVQKILAPWASLGLTAEAAPAKLSLTEQSDGFWRVAMTSYPQITFHFQGGDMSFAVDGYKFDGVYDPQILAFSDGRLSADKVSFRSHRQETDQTGEYDQISATLKGQAGAAGEYSGTVHEDIKNYKTTIVAKKTADATAAAPVFNMEFGALALDVALENTRLRQALDLWRFMVAHPARPDLAANEDALKNLLRALLPVADKIDESGAAQDWVIDTPKGPIKLGGAKFRIAADKVPSKGQVEAHLAFDKIAPPPNVAPPGVQDLVPTAVDLGVKVNGVDFGAAAEEAINDLHLAGEGPVISDIDRPKISGKLLGGGAMDITVLPSRIVAPQLDVTVEGAVQVTGGKPSGKITITAKNFDNTVTAIKGAGSLATPQTLAGLTMAKGLGKAGADNTTVWVVEYAVDGAIKLNGLPLGKAPPP